MNKVRRAVPESNSEGAVKRDRWERVDNAEQETLLDYTIADKAIEYLENRPKDQPFLIGCGFPQAARPVRRAGQIF